MSTIGQVLMALADTIYVWRDIAIAILACIVIACLWVYASALGEQ